MKILYLAVLAVALSSPAQAVDYLACYTIGFGPGTIPCSATNKDCSPRHLHNGVIWVCGTATTSGGLPATDYQRITGDAVGTTQASLATTDCGSWLAGMREICVMARPCTMQQEMGGEWQCVPDRDKEWLTNYATFYGLGWFGCGCDPEPPEQPMPPPEEEDEGPPPEEPVMSGDDFGEDFGDDFGDDFGEDFGEEFGESILGGGE